jgi:hypothetical protein
MKTRLTVALATLVLGGSLLLASVGAVMAVAPAGPAGAAGPAGQGVCRAAATSATKTLSLDTLRAFGDCEINRRLTTLDQLTARVSDSKSLTSSDVSALKNIIVNTRSGLTSLKTKIDAETTPKLLRAEVVKIVTDYRVYLLVLPQVNLVNGADAVLSTQAKFATVNTNLTARIATAKKAGKDVTAAQKALDDMNTQVTAAVALANPEPALLLALTPAQYDGGSASPVLQTARANLVQARDDLKAALADAQTCRNALK